MLYSALVGFDLCTETGECKGLAERALPECGQRRVPVSRGTVRILALSRTDYYKLRPMIEVLRVGKTGYPSRK